MTAACGTPRLSFPGSNLYNQNITHPEPSAVKKKSHKEKKGEHPRSGAITLSELGDALREKDPDMMKRVDALHAPESSAEKITQVLHDVLPFAWKDLEAFEQAVEHLLNRRHEEAVQSLETAIEEDPGAYPAQHLMGLCLSGTDRLKQEIDCYKKAAKLNPNYPQVYLDLARAYWQQGKEKKAFAEFKRIVPMIPDFAVAEFWMDFLNERLGCIKKSAGAASDPSRTLAHASYWLGMAYLEFSLHIPARHAFKKAARLMPEFAEAVYQLGAIHIKRLRNPKRAQKYLEKAEQLFSAQGELQRATLVHQQCRPSETVADPGRAADEWLKEGLRLQQLGSCQGAIDAYRMAIHIRPDFVDALYNLGIAYGSLEDTGGGDIGKAVSALKRVIRVKPDYHHAHIALGASYIKQQQFTEAIEVLNQALAHAPEEASVYYYLGVAHRVTGQSEEAVRYLKHAVRINPDPVHVQFYYALALTDLSRYDDACDVFQTVVQAKPDFADAHFLLGSLYLEKLGETDKAHAHLRKAEKLFLKLEDHQRLAMTRRLLSRQAADSRHEPQTA